MHRHPPARGAIAAALAAAGLAACTTTAPSLDDRLQARVQNIVVIYAENRSFDNLFGHFPGASGLSEVMDADGKPTAAYVAQKDRDGTTVLAQLPQTWGGLTAPGVTPVVTQAQSAGLPNGPFAIETAFVASAGARLSLATNTHDLVHRFYENQMQIHGGRNDMFAAWTDAGGLTMGHFDYSGSAIYRLARENVLADHFFQGAFGGSFLNHQYLICACAPDYPNADTSPAKGSISVLEKDAAGHDTPVLARAPNSPASALDGPPRFVLSGNLTPANYFGDGKYYAVNTMQPAFQPSGNKPADATGHHPFYASPAAATTLPALTGPTIGDRLTARQVGWAWYAGAWRAANADGRQPPSAARKVIYSSNASGLATPQSVGFQAHHQPFNYYAAFDPVTRADDRAAHLKDYEDLVADAAAGRLPPVVFYKPEGVYNQHEGYANLADGDAKIADLVARLQASPQWKNMVIVITYDEFGGVWDHVAPPTADRLGPGTRIPAIIVSPFARRGTVDHTPYDTGSVLRLITRRFQLESLPGVVARDAALKAAGEPPMGDLTGALVLD